MSNIKEIDGVFVELIDYINSQIERGLRLRKHEEDSHDRTYIDGSEYAFSKIKQRIRQIIKKQK